MPGSPTVITLHLEDGWESKGEIPGDLPRYLQVAYAERLRTLGIPAFTSTTDGW